MCLNFASALKGTDREKMQMEGRYLFSSEDIFEYKMFLSATLINICRKYIYVLDTKLYILSTIIDHFFNNSY